MDGGICSTAVLQPVKKSHLSYYQNIPKKLTIEEMIKNAIIALSEKKGVPLSAIKKYMLGTYLYDVTKKRVYIHKFLKAAVADGRLIRNSRKGLVFYKIRFVGSDESCKKGVRKTAPMKRSLKNKKR
ncbi:unnamed protein product [Nezara viridula]|uniref:H15 domain-containing protein n=1 Tax=Nezara viridula TaxID=85310 RepID=A0A9P0E1P8_NEZVI|nr:unnamed protein product [Nezara viridula]